MSAVAGDAVGLDHPLGMGFMAIVALRDVAMGGLVTLETLQLLVFGLAGVQSPQGLFMTGAALCGGDSADEGRRHRAVRLMAVLALVSSHVLRVRCMTLAALRNISVPGFVTVDTGEHAVFGSTIAQDIKNLIMAAGAIRGGEVHGEGDVKRFVRLVALLTILFNHGRRMRLVAIGAFWHDAVSAGMTGGTIQRAVITREIFQLLAFTFMTGQARDSQFLAENDFQGTVRILMAAEACLELIVGSSTMTLAACRDNLQIQGRMPLVAVQAGDVGFVRPASLFDITWRIEMAIDTTADIQPGVLGIGNIG